MTFSDDLKLILSIVMPGKLPKVICGCLMLLYLCLDIHAQNPYLNLDFRQLSLEKGLSQSNVSAIIQDKKGFMWAGTHNGLNRYDGYSFTSFGTEHGLSRGYISVLFESSDGKIWMGNPSGIVDVLHPSTFEIQQLALPFKEGQTTGTLKFYEDEAGRIWISTRSGIHIYDPSRETFFQFPDKGGLYDRVNKYGVYEINQDAQGRLWAATQSGLTSIAEVVFGSAQEVDAKLGLPPKDHPYLNSGLIFKLTKSKKGGFWLNAWQKGLIYYEPYADIYEFYPIVATEEQGENVEIYEVIEDQEGAVWATTKNHGLLHLDSNAQHISYARYEAGRASALGSNTLQGIAEDSEGGIWVGTYGAGVNYFSPRPSSFIHIKQDEAPAGLSYPLVYEIYPSRYEDDIWIGTHGGGLNRMRRKNGDKGSQVFHYLPRPGQPKSLKDDVVITLEEDGNKNLWVGTYHGLSLLPAEKKSRNLGALVFKEDLGKGPKWDLLATSAIWSLLHDSRGRMWIGTPSGLFRKEADSDHLTQYVKDPANPYAIRNYFIRELYQDPDGNIWFATGNGLHRYRENTDDFFIYGAEGPETSSLSSNSSYCLLVDLKNRIWLGTQGSGLNVILPDPSLEEFKVRKFFESDGLPANLIMGLLLDDFGQIWGSTSRGLFRFNPDSVLLAEGELDNLWRIYDEKDGLQSNEFLEGAFAKTPDGHLFFGGVNGFNEFDPKEITDVERELPVYFTELKILNESIEIGEELRSGEIILTEEISHIERLNLSWKDYFFSLSFTALGYSFPEKTQYAYRLDGLNEDWYYIGNQRAVTFTNLDPGDYMLRVKARNRDGIWNQTERRLAIHISTPPWKSWWAYALYGMTLLALIGAYIRYRVREREKELETRMRIEQAKSEERELVRKNTAADFHDELGNKMTKISLFIELAKRAETANQTLHVYLNQVEENTQILSQGIRDFIWVLDPEKDSVYDMLIRIKDFGDELFEHTGISFVCEGIHPDQSQYKLPLSSRRNLMLMAKESMNNSLKYAEATLLHLRASTQPETLHIEISDDGKGFDIEEVSKGYGLKNIQTRAEKIGAQAEIVSKAGEGTRILISLDLPHMGD